MTTKLADFHTCGLARLVQTKKKRCIFPLLVLLCFVFKPAVTVKLIGVNIIKVSGLPACIINPRGGKSNVSDKQQVVHHYTASFTCIFMGCGKKKEVTTT